MLPVAERPGVEIQRHDSFAWFDLVTRGRWKGVIGGGGRVTPAGKKTRGDVSPAIVRAVASAWFRAADANGTRMCLSDGRTAVLAEVDVKSVKLVKAFFLRLGLLAYAGRNRIEGMLMYEYHLTVPSDLLDLLTVLTPAQVGRSASETVERNRSSKAKAARQSRTAAAGAEEVPVVELAAAAGAEEVPVVELAAAAGAEEVPVVELAAAAGAEEVPVVELAAAAGAEEVPVVELAAERHRRRAGAPAHDDARSWRSHDDPEVVRQRTMAGAAEARKALARTGKVP